MNLGYRYNIVDIHSHILPKCDDGSASIKESIALIYAAMDEGIKDIIATPHYGKENGYEPNLAVIKKAFQYLKNECSKEEYKGIRLYLGEELYCSDDLSDRLKKYQAITINDTRYALVEFLEYGEVYENADTIKERLKKFKKSGYLPILAHAERYHALQENWEELKRIQDMGVLIQVNAYDLSLSQNRQTRELAQWLATERMISFIGSDMHGMPPKRPPKVKEGVEWLYKHTDWEYANCVVRKNAEKELRVKKYSNWETGDFFMTPRMAVFFETRLYGKIVRCQIFPAKENSNISAAVIELEDSRAYAIVDGVMGPRIYRMESYADSSNSIFECDESGWRWLWKGSGKEVELTNLGGVEW